jgi:hypothetical protein
MAAFVIMTVVSIATAASSKILADEFTAWRPHLTKKLITLAVRRLPEEQCERYREEWLSYVEEIPGELGKLLAAVGLLWAGIKLRSVLRRGSRIATVAKKNEFVRCRLLFHTLDMAAFACSVFLAFELRFDGAMPAQLVHPMFTMMFIWAGCQSAGFIACKVNWNNWRYTSAYNAALVVVASTAGSIVGWLVIGLLLGLWGIPRSVYILAWLLASLLTLGGRFALRFDLKAS